MNAGVFSNFPKLLFVTNVENLTRHRLPVELKSNNSFSSIIDLIRNFGRDM